MSEYARFKSDYDRQVKRWHQVLKNAKQDLERGLQELNSRAEHPPVRVRQVECRIKASRSLFRKLKSDGTDLHEGLETEKTPDILGLRVVVNNLQDLELIGNAVLGAKTFSFAPSQRHHAAKKWIDPPQDSGYRGWHLDVRLSDRHNGRNYFAELQIRTTLQDSWATLTHDDVFHSESSALDPAAEKQLRYSSDLIFTLDKMAQELRTSIENRNVHGLKVRVWEAIESAMFSLASFGADAVETVPYLKIARDDHYSLSRNVPKCLFEVDGTCHDSRQFTHFVGGDTPGSNFELLAFRYLKNGRWVPVPPYEREIKKLTDRLLMIRHKRRSKVHRYQIECAWKGIFTEAVEYVWCPWTVLYGGAKGEYRLTLHGRKAICGLPLLLNMGDYTSIRDALDAFERAHGWAPAQRKNEYFWHVRDPKGVPFCLFRMSANQP